MLVVLVVVVFLQTWRAAIIPLVAIPVSLVGTFFFMAAFGYTLNNLSLFGLVLAIGIVVDDAIVVVENVERNIAANRAVANERASVGRRPSLDTACMAMANGSARTAMAGSRSGGQGQGSYGDDEVAGKTTRDRFAQPRHYVAQRRRLQATGHAPQGRRESTTTVVPSATRRRGNPGPRPLPRGPKSPARIATHAPA